MAFISLICGMLLPLTRVRGTRQMIANSVWHTLYIADANTVIYET